ncbi:MAG: Fur family transcriptional regulator [Sphingobacteriales bacterium]|nr:MAG: Fur family transcriptional regulator [Sphingobacteriales bacterium]
MKQTRNTLAKSKIISMLQAAEVALSHAEIEAAIDIEVNRVTIYRILDRLIEAGTIHKVVNTDGAMKFAMCHNCSVTHHHNHIHFSCVVCKEVTCLEDVVPSFKLSKQYEVIDVNFTLSGRCPNCRAKAN